MEDRVRLTDFRNLRRSSSVGDLADLKASIEREREKRERATRLEDEKKKAVQHGSPHVPPRRTRSQTVSCSEGPTKKPRPSPRHTKSLRLSREESQTSDDSSLAPSVQDLEIFTSDRNLTRPKQLLKPIPIHQENESDNTRHKQVMYSAEDLDSEPDHLFIVEDKTVPFSPRDFMSAPVREGNSSSPNREACLINRNIMDHSLPALDYLPQIKVKSRAYSEKNLYRPQSKVGYIQSTKAKGNTRVFPSSYKVGAFRSTPNVAYSADPDAGEEESDALVNSIPETQDDDRHSPSDKCSVVNVENLHVDFLKDESLETPFQFSEKSPFVRTGTEDSSSKSSGSCNVNTDLKNSVTTILSVLYATIIVVIGSVMSMTESFLKANRPLAFELFYIFIYSASIGFLLFVYIFLLRKRSGEIIKQAVRRLSFHDSQPIFKRVVTFSNVGHSGSFYLRLGAIGFGIGGMILDGLYVAEKFEDYGNPHACHPDFAAATYIVKMIFAFSQLYFVFNNAEMRMLTHQSLAKFGLMHMTATNICEWYRTVVVETLETLSKELEVQNEATKNVTEHEHDHGNITDHKHCLLSKFVGNIIKDTSPYLYPFKIEYNLICAGILYVMWRHLAYNSEVKRLPLSRLDSNGDKRRRRLTVDCSSSSKGLFLGILLFVTVVISLKSFYSLVQVDPNSINVLLVSHFTEIALYTMALICTIVAAVRMKNLKFDRNERAKLEENLIGISQLGLFMYGIFSLVAGSIEYYTARGAFTIVTNIVMMMQAALQTIFLFPAMRMSARKEHSNKPGREFVTFLLLCNFCLWVVNTFETIRPEHNSVQISIYGQDAWAIFVHISVPLAIFYRFHSTVCLSHIWKYAWKAKVETQ